MSLTREPVDAGPAARAPRVSARLPARLPARVPARMSVRLLRTDFPRSSRVSAEMLIPNLE